MGLSKNSWEIEIFVLNIHKWVISLVWESSETYPLNIKKVMALLNQCLLWLLHINSILDLFDGCLFHLFQLGNFLLQLWYLQQRLVKVSRVIKRFILYFFTCENTLTYRELHQSLTRVTHSSYAESCWMNKTTEKLEKVW